MRSLAIFLAAAALGGIAIVGAGLASDERQPPPRPTVAVTTQATSPTADQLAVRERLAAEAAAGKDCGCTGGDKAAYRIATGKAKKPAAKDLVSNQP